MAELTIGGDAIREWIGPDGQEWVAAAPYVLAIGRQLKREGIADPTTS
jgi:hypothetical protein